MKKKNKNQEGESGVLRLIKKRRKGLLRIVFSRFGIIFALFIIQIVGVIAIFDLLDENFEWFALAMGFFIIAKIFIINHFIKFILFKTI